MCVGGWGPCATGLLLDAAGHFICNTYSESCTWPAFVFWLVLLLLWAVATFILGRARSVGFFECVVLGLSLNIAFALWGVLSAALNLDLDFADDDLREAVLAVHPVPWDRGCRHRNGSGRVDDGLTPTLKR